MNNEEKILSMLEQMNGRFDKVDTRLDKLEQGQAKLEQGQVDLKQDVRRLNQSVTVLESKVNHDFNIIIEGITDLNERNRQIDKLESVQENHDHRIWALEQAVKK